MYDVKNLLRLKQLDAHACERRIEDHMKALPNIHPGEVLL
jgi:hypothetical protein